MNLTDAAYKVSLKKGLSKAYTLEKLRRARDAGQVADSDLCTADEGDNSYKLGELLSYAEALAVQSDVQDRSDESSMGSEMEKSVYGFQPVFEPQDSEVRSSGSAATRSRSTRHSSSSTHVRSSVQSAAAVAVQSPDDSNYLGGPAAAEDALNSALHRRRQAREAAENHTSEASDFIGDIGAPVGGSSTLHSVIAGCAGGIFTALLCAAAWFAVGGKSDSDLMMASVFSNADVAPVVADSRFEPMTLEELSARFRIMNAQLKLVVRNTSVSAEGVAEIPELEPLSSPKIDLLPYVPVQMKSRDRSKFDLIFDQYVELVQSSGPDGRNIDDRTVDLFTGRLTQLISQPGQDGATRSEAAHDASEKCKLLYLLQLGKLRSDDIVRQLEGQAAMQAAGRATINRLYLECAAGDATFPDVLRSAPDNEKQELVLIRYWYYRSVDAKTAAMWLERMLKDNPLISADEVRASIAEVDAVENS